jgi:GDP-mannose transporter
MCLLELLHRNENDKHSNRCTSCTFHCQPINFAINFSHLNDHLQVTAILGCKMETHNEVYLNNFLSIPLVGGLMVIFGEPVKLLEDPALRNPMFQLVALILCGVGFSISYAALWFMSTTTPTSYSLVGSLNKIPVAIAGILLFNAQTTPANLASICVGLIAGVLFVKAKQR